MPNLQVPLTEWKTIIGSAYYDYNELKTSMFKILDFFKNVVWLSVFFFL